MLGVGINLWRTSLTHGGAIIAPPAFPPNISGTQATIAADFAGNQYWASGASKASFAAWLTAIGGTYSRASSATYLQGGVVKSATANTPRFPTDLGGTAQGIRLTGPATNILLQSNSFSTAPTWSLQGGTVVVQNVAGPDGVANSAWTFTSAFNANACYQSSGSTGQSTLSWFAKAGTDTFTFIYTSSGTGSTITWFNLSPGAIGTVNLQSGGSTIVHSSPSITPLANGWFLVSVVVTGEVAFPEFGFSSADAVSNEPVDGKTGFGYGAQITQTAFPCDYIPTTTATVTQAADLISSFTHAFGVNATMTTGWQQSPDPTAAGSSRLWNCDLNAPGIAPLGYILPSGVGNITQRAGINNAAYSWDATTLSVVMNGATQQDNLAQAVGAKTLIQIGAAATSPSVWQPNTNMANFALWDIRATTVQCLGLAP